MPFAKRLARTDNERRGQNPPQRVTLAPSDCRSGSCGPGKSGGKAATQTGRPRSIIRTAMQCSSRNFHRKQIMRIPGSVPAFLLFVFLAASSLRGQNIPDRIVIIDPLGDTAAAGEGLALLPGTRLYGEFARYSSGSGTDHRWNAKLGGYGEFVRWDASWSIAVAGTMEVIVDPNNDISFNPRAIFWEEGLIISARAPWSGNGAVQFGYMHRCKHDIDNAEKTTLGGEPEQRTLIYSGPFLRLLNRPAKILDGPVELRVGGALRFDYFVHTLDSRWNPRYAESQPNLEDLTAAINGTVRIEGRFGDGPFGLHAGGNWMLALASPRGEGMEGFGSLPFVELGLDIRNPGGGAFTIFARGERQRDGGIGTRPKPADLFLFGVRIGGAEGMW